MKWLYLVAALAVITLNACGQRSNPPPSQSASPGHPTSVRSTGNLFVYTDEETGCQYLKPSGEAALTPRMGRDGRQVCK